MTQYTNKINTLLLGIDRASSQIKLFNCKMTDIRAVKETKMTIMRKMHVTFLLYGNQKATKLNYCANRDWK
ncbi:hypothetical protein KGMB02408_15260 [Bacteroides faecalis]|uniref:Uncharacterized protein n=1 Tax=Bacteroides faecalis TaxID=2447885 RepID=A0A401LT15_9BACE|nr:hypothetical protein KGMB02408_15260 [Bacteroides faecalis]